MLNVWTNGWYHMGSPRNILDNIGHFFRCFKYSYQRITRGYSDWDVWSLNDYWTDLMANSLDTLADTTHGYPARLTEETSTYEHWVAYLHDLANLLRRTREDDPYYKNEYAEAEYATYDKWTWDEDEKGNHVLNQHRTPEEDELSKKYFARELEIWEQKQKDVKEAMRQLGEHWYEFWD